MQEWKEKIRIVRGRLAWASLPLCFCGLVLFDAALRFFYRAAGSTRFLDWRAFVFTGAWSLLLTGAAALLPPLGRRIAMGVYAVFFGLLSVVHGVMFNIFGEFFTFSDTNFAGDGAKFFSLSYLNLRKALVASIVLAMLLLAVGAWLVPKRQPGKPRWPRLAGASGAILLSLVSVVLLNRSLLPQADTMTWGSLFDPSSEEQAYKDFTDSNRCLLMTGLYQYTVRDFVVSFGLEASPVDLNSLDQFYEERAGQVSGENEYTGLYEGKSLLMVMLESIDTWLLTPEYMPNLYALQQQGTNFVHNYTPLFLSAGTFNTEFISQTGLLPSVTGLSSSIYSTNSFPFSLAHQFSQQGYTVGSFHTASAGIYSRGSIHQNLGMTYHSGAEMGMDDYMLDSQMMEGYLTDKEFLYQLKGVSADSPELYRTPCFFYAKGQQPQTVEKYVAPVDLAPTIVNLFGLDTDTRYYMGDDMFGDQGGVVLFPDGGWYDGETYYTSEYQGEVTQEMRDTSAMARRREEASFNTLRADYFARREIS